MILVNNVEFAAAQSNRRSHLQRYSLPENLSHSVEETQQAAVKMTGERAFSTSMMGITLVSEQYEVLEYQTSDSLG